LKRVKKILWYLWQPFRFLLLIIMTVTEKEEKLIPRMRMRKKKTRRFNAMLEEDET
jgi:hypothetical protein